jgi:hypothetical protein
VRPHQVLHVVRAASAISGQMRWVVVGTQAAALWPGQCSELLLQSMELDLYPADDPSLAELVDGAIGEESTFHDTFGYYAHGVGPETATLPEDWLSRATTVLESVTQAQVLVPSPTDVAISKLCAFREKDLRWVQELLRLRLTTVEAVLQALERTTVEKALREQATRWLAGQRGA